MTNTKSLTKTEIAALMGCKYANAVSRLVALGYTDVCGRCAGSGRYSWNQVDGDKCFGCGGAGKVLAKINRIVVDEALARIEAGELVAYFAENTARREMKSAHEALWAAYMSTAIAAAYNVEEKAWSKRAIARSRSGLEPYGPENDLGETPAARAQQLQNLLMDRASNAMYDRKSTHAARIAIIREVHAMVLELNRIWSLPRA